MTYLTVLLTLSLVVSARNIAAQDTTRTPTPVSPDSLAERLRRAEAIALLKEQMATQAESQVQSASRVRVELWTSAGERVLQLRLD